ncbi:204_t:CDS:10 [Dentiscutata erythropus]|uniref:204_t:CDS:1 n=1 Tax=Dentiscutata erythropus TaxID=1348616 RepID=A0A9N8VG38_9GLOM|nr:204_t:CDS:10 [Dentiscutata erythropus]
MKIFEKPTIITEYLDQCIVKEDDDWTLIIDTCNAVNATDAGAKEAAKFIRKKLARMQSIKIQHRVLSVLQAMAENCGAKFHAEIASKKFLEAIEHVIVTPNFNPDVKHRLVELLRNWTEMFQNEPSLWQVANLYNKLEKMGVIPEDKYQNNPTQNPRRVHHAPSTTSVETIAGDIELAKNNVQLFIQTISFTDPEAEDITKNELIQEFYRKCKSLLQNINQYINEVQDEHWLDTLLSINQELIKAFQMYDDMVERGQIRAAEQISVQFPTDNYRVNYDNYFDSDDAGVGGSKATAIDPFSDYNEVEQIPSPSEKRRGKVPMSIYDDDDVFRDDPNELSNQQYSSLVAPLQPTKYRPPTVTNNNNGRQDHMSI